MQQTTIKKAIECSGIGLHGGRKVKMRLRPAPEETGIVFCLHRADGSTRFLRPNPHGVMANGLATVLVDGEDRVATVEHLLAALRGLGVDNVFIDVQGPELPIMDGSAASFVFLIRSAGLRRQSSPRRVLGLTRPLKFEQDGKWIKAEPHAGFMIDYTIDFAHPMIGVQRMRLDLKPENFIRELAKARTFGFLAEVEMLQRKGLALGGSLDNAVVLDDYSVVNAEGLRYADEFVRHKMLDFVGDMAIIGLPLAGRFEVHCSGHAMNNAFLRTLDDHRDMYLTETTEDELASELTCVSGFEAVEVLDEHPAGIPATA